MSREQWTTEDEANFRLLQERRRSARERQRQGRAENIENRRNIYDGRQVRARGGNGGAVQHEVAERMQEGPIANNDSDEDMYDPNLAALGGDRNDDEHIPLNGETIRTFYQVVGHKARRVGRFRAEAVDYQIVVRPLDVLLRNHGAYEIVHALLESIFNLMRDGVQPHDRIGMIIDGGGLQAPIWIPLMRNDQFSVERIMLAVEGVLQSNADFLTERDGFEVSFLHISMPAGRGNSTVSRVDFEKWMKGKRCFVKIRNRDSMCCARALAVAIAHSNKTASSEAGRYYKSICEVNRVQKEAAIYLHEKSGVPIGGSCGIDELKLFQHALPDYQIVVYSKNTFNEILYAGPHKTKQLFLYHYDDHYATITAMPAFLEKTGFCGNCLKGYSVKKKHICSASCACCRMGPCEITEWQHCPDCRRYFKNPTCLKNHKLSGKKKGSEEGKTVCQQVYRCKGCGMMIDQIRNGAKKKHVCGERYCRNCRITVDCEQTHLCYMQRTTQKCEVEEIMTEIDKVLGCSEEGEDDADSDSDVSQSCEKLTYEELQNKYTSLAERYDMLKHRMTEAEGNPEESAQRLARSCKALMKRCKQTIPAYIFYDFECRQDDVIGENKLGKIYKHVPNLCIAYRVCTLCWEKEDETCS